MAEEPQKPPQMNVLGQFIRDMSFENVAAQKGLDGNLQPDIQVQVNLDARKREKDGNFEVVMKLNIESKGKDIDEVLFVIMTLGDDRTNCATYVAGERVYSRDLQIRREWFTDSLAVT